MKLSSQGVSDLIKRLESLQSKTENAVFEAVTESIYPTVDRITQVATQVVGKYPRTDTGESVAGIGWEFPKKGTLLIYQQGTHVFENEFGNGAHFGGYPKPEVIPNGVPTNNEPYSFEPNPQSRWYKGAKKDGSPKKVHAQGQYPDAQMYQGSLVLREELPKKVKQKVGEVLSQI